MINDKISTILGVRVGKGEYKAAFNRLDRIGAINMKTLMEMVIVLCDTVEELEDEIKFKDMSNDKKVSLQPNK